VGSLSHVGRCPECGKRRYLSKREAKAAARTVHRGAHLAAYACGDYWHLGHLNAKVFTGEMERSELEIRKKR
jgi:hypothetical protein